MVHINDYSILDNIQFINVGKDNVSYFTDLVKSAFTYDPNAIIGDAYLFPEENGGDAIYKIYKEIKEVYSEDKENEEQIQQPTFEQPQQFSPYPQYQQQYQQFAQPNFGTGVVPNSVMRDIRSNTPNNNPQQYQQTNQQYPYPEYANNVPTEIGEFLIDQKYKYLKQYYNAGESVSAINDRFIYNDMVATAYNAKTFNKDAELVSSVYDFMFRTNLKSTVKKLSIPLNREIPPNIDSYTTQQLEAYIIELKTQINAATGTSTVNHMINPVAGFLEDCFDGEKEYPVLGKFNLHGLQDNVKKDIKGDALWMHNLSEATGEATMFSDPSFYLLTKTFHILYSTNKENSRRAERDNSKEAKDAKKLLEERQKNREDIKYLKEKNKKLEEALKKVVEYAKKNKTPNKETKHTDYVDKDKTVYTKPITIKGPSFKSQKPKTPVKKVVKKFDLEKTKTVNIEDYNDELMETV